MEKRYDQRKKCAFYVLKSRSEVNLTAKSALLKAMPL